MIILLLILAFTLWILGIWGCFNPVLPGPVLAWISLLVLFFMPEPLTLHASWLIVAGLFTIVVLILDFIIPGKMLKRKGGSKEAIRGANIGVWVGMFFGPFGVMFGPPIGAIIGELITNKPINQAIRSGIFAGLSFLLSTGVKLMLCLGFGFFLFRTLWIAVFRI